MSRLTRSVVAGLIALGALSPLAAAKPGTRTFEQTYPHAAKLCARADAGTLGKRLKPSTAQVKADCQALRGTFAKAQSDDQAATVSIPAQAQAALAQAKSACEKARQSHDPAACRQARQQARTTLRGLRGTARDAAKAYRAAIEGGRKTFWAAIKTLRGGAGEAPDAPSTESPPAPVVPPDPRA
jgi:hypothetical protein